MMPGLQVQRWCEGGMMSPRGLRKEMGEQHERGSPRTSRRHSGWVFPFLLGGETGCRGCCDLYACCFFSIPTLLPCFSVEEVASWTLGSGGSQVPWLRQQWGDTAAQDQAMARGKDWLFRNMRSLWGNLGKVRDRRGVLRRDDNAFFAPSRNGLEIIFIIKLLPCLGVNSVYLFCCHLPLNRF